MNNKRITNLGNPVDTGDAVNKGFFDNIIRGMDSEMERKLDKNEEFSMNNKRITNVGNPVDKRDVVNKNYVDVQNSDLLNKLNFSDVLLKVIYMNPTQLVTIETYFNEHGEIISTENGSHIYKRSRGIMVFIVALHYEVVSTPISYWREAHDNLIKGMRIENGYLCYFGERINVGKIRVIVLTSNSVANSIPPSGRPRREAETKAESQVYYTISNPQNLT